MDPERIDASLQAITRSAIADHTISDIARQQAAERGEVYNPDKHRTSLLQAAALAKEYAGVSETIRTKVLELIHEHLDLGHEDSNYSQFKMHLYRELRPSSELDDTEKYDLLHLLATQDIDSMKHSLKVRRLGYKDWCIFSL